MFENVESSVVLAVLGYFGYLIRDIPSAIFNYILPRISYSIAFISKDFLVYEVGNKWISELDSNIIKKNMQYSSLESSQNGEIVTTINYGAYLFFIDQYTIIYIHKFLMDHTNMMQDRMYIRIVGFNQAKYINKLQGMLNELYSRDNLYMRFKSYGSAIPIEKKSFDDIFSPEKEDIIRAIDTWINSKSIYKKHGIIYKLGILLYGEPGTGKSSIARAIASYLGWDLVSIDLKNEPYDLINWVSTMGKKKVVMLEDIDCIISSRGNTDFIPLQSSTGGVSTPIDDKSQCFDTLLNILDGAISPSDVIFVATTNYIDNLDKAFKREGRFDHKICLTSLSKENAVEMCKSYDVDPSILDNESIPINPAYLQSKLLNMKTK
jgi:ATP-dependent Zn protease